MKADRYELGAIINSLDRRRKKEIISNQDTLMLDKLILRLLKINESLK